MIDGIRDLSKSEIPDRMRANGLMKHVTLELGKLRAYGRKQIQELALLPSFWCSYSQLILGDSGKIFGKIRSAAEAAVDIVLIDLDEGKVRFAFLDDGELLTIKTNVFDIVEGMEVVGRGTDY